MAHEPPTAALLPDRDAILAVRAGHARDLRQPGQRARCRDGEVHPVRDVRRPRAPRPTSTSPPPDPAMFGMSSEDDGSRTDPLMRNMPGCVALPARPRGAGRASATGWCWPSAWSRAADGRARRPVGGRGARAAGDRVPQQPRRVPRRRARPARATPTASPPPCADDARPVPDVDRAVARARAQPARGPDQRVEQPLVAAHLGVPLHGEAEALAGGLHRLERPVVGVRDGLEARVRAHRLVVVAVHGRPPDRGSSAAPTTRVVDTSISPNTSPPGLCSSCPTRSGVCWSRVPPAATAITCIPRHTPSVGRFAAAAEVSRASSHASRSGRHDGGARVRLLAVPAAGRRPHRR